MKLSLALIAKDEEKVVERCLSSVVPYVDEVIFVDTGSTDKTKTLAKKYLKKSGKEYKILDFKWVDDFSAARNFSFKQCTGDFILWMDLDDVLLKGELIKSVLSNISSKVAGVQLVYLYEVDDQGNVMVQHWKDRLIRNNGLARWEGKLHENIFYQGDGQVVRNEEVRVLQLWDYKKRNKRKLQNIRILQKELKGQGDNPDPRTIVNLGNAYRSNEEYAKAIEYFNKYLTMSGWDEERYQTLISMGKMYMEFGDDDGAIKAGLVALKEMPNYPGAYFLIAEAYYHKKEWLKCVEWCQMGFKKPIPTDSVLLINFRDYDLRPLTFLADALSELGRFTEAVVSIDKALEIKKNDSSLLEMREKYQKLKRHKKVSHAIKDIASYLRDNKQEDKIASFLQYIPSEHKDLPMVTQIGSNLTTPREWEDNEIAIFCGNSWDIWSPKTVKEGIGGSEEAVIYLSKELVRLGWKVTVYNNCYDESGNYDGVEYKSYLTFNPKDTFNILVDWRYIDLVKEPITAKRIYVWLHDLPNPHLFTPERLERVHKVIVLSDYQRSLLPDIPDDKIFISTNGLLPEQFEKPELRDPYKMIYTSSYDRGLEYTLDVWPQIKRSVPQATLDIYYGWGLYYEKYKDNPERMDWMRMMKEKMVRLPGVTERGRIGHGELAKEFLRSSVWPYSSDFPEISCITAMKAQAAGVYPVTSGFAALKETVTWGVNTNLDPKTKKGKSVFAKEVIKALKHPPTEKEREQAKRKYSKFFQWSNTAKGWDKEFRNGKDTYPLYSKGWAKDVWNRLPKDIQREELKPYTLEYDNA